MLAAAGIRVIEWPPFSPDLNPIKTLWNDMKDYIQEYYPKVYSSYKRL
jgi:transposase